jgi:hypothetical protein
MTVATRARLGRATCQLMSGPNGMKCPNNADGVWRLGTEEHPTRFIPLCGTCMDGLQEEFTEAWTDAQPEPFLVFWDD